MARRREQLHQSPSNNKTTIQRENTAPIFTSLQIKINQVISKMKNTRVALCFSLAFVFYGMYHYSTTLIFHIVDQLIHLA
jgi:hypothetical protein